MSYDALLRPDTLTRYQAHKIALDAGFLTIDEVRQLEHREPLGEDEPADMEEPPELDDDLSYQEDGLDQDTPAFDMEDMNS